MRRSSLLWRLTKLEGRGRKGTPGGVSTAYVTGDRTASITVTAAANTLDVTALESNLVDGGFGANGTDSAFFKTGGFTVDGTKWIKFDFGTAKVVDEAKWYQDVSDTHGSWKWRGSNDDSAYTDIGSSFTLGGTLQTQTQLNGNTTAYRYLLLEGVSGTATDNPWLEEIEFKQSA